MPRGIGMTTKTTAHLRREHDEIRQRLRGLSGYLRALEGGDTGGCGEAADFLDSLGEGLLQKHEEKEEDIILPQLARMGLSWSDGALAHVRKDHRHGRDFFRTLRQSMHLRNQWSSFERAHFLSIARAWVEFVKEHMIREERILFPFMDANLSSEDDALIVSQLEKTDTEYADMAASTSLVSDGRFAQRLSGKCEQPGVSKAREGSEPSSH